MPSEASDRPDHEALAALLRASTALVTDREAPARLEGDPNAWLAQMGVPERDAKALAALGERRLLLYRRHVRRSLARGVQIEIPRTAARLGDRFAVWVDRWIEEVGPRSRYFRDLAFELVAFAAPLWLASALASGGEPAYLADLARHELVYFEVAAAPDVAWSVQAGEIELGGPVRFTPSARLARYAHAVHELPDDPDDRTVPVARPTTLFVYRDAEHDVRFLELTPLAAAIVERLLAGAALGPAVTEACAAIGSALDASVTAGTATLLEDLVTRGAVLGGEPC